MWISKTVHFKEEVTIGWWYETIGTRHAIKWYQFQWPRVTPDPDFIVALFFEIKYVKKTLHDTWSLGEMFIYKWHTFMMPVCQNSFTFLSVKKSRFIYLFSLSCHLSYDFCWFWWFLGWMLSGSIFLCGSGKLSSVRILVRWSEWPCCITTIVLWWIVYVVGDTGPKQGWMTYISRSVVVLVTLDQSKAEWHTCHGL